jgi:hypothetical protein
MTDTFEPIPLSEKARPWLHALASLLVGVGRRFSDA